MCDVQGASLIVRNARRGARRALRAVILGIICGSCGISIATGLALGCCRRTSKLLSTRRDSGNGCCRAVYALQIDRYTGPESSLSVRLLWAKYLFVSDEALARATGNPAPMLGSPLRSGFTLLDSALAPSWRPARHPLVRGAFGQPDRLYIIGAYPSGTFCYGGSGHTQWNRFDGGSLSPWATERHREAGLFVTARVLTFSGAAPLAVLAMVTLARRWRPARAAGFPLVPVAAASGIRAKTKTGASSGHNEKGATG